MRRVLLILVVTVGTFVVGAGAGVPPAGAAPRCTLVPHAADAGCDFAGRQLSRVNLRGANLTNADLAGANLTGANLIDANLSGADLVGATLATANLTGASLVGATCPNGIVFGAPEANCL